MKIVHINLFDQEGGAARIANDIGRAAQEAGHDVYTFAHRAQVTDNPRVISLPFDSAAYFKNLLMKQQNNGLFDLYSTALVKVLNHSIFHEADIIHLHCINAGYFSYFLLPFLAAKKLVWTFHDPLVFTAQCLYPHHCDQWQNDFCAECPKDRQQPTTVLAPRRENVQKLKHDIFQLAPVTVVAPSQWMYDNVRASFLRDVDTRLIYNGIDIQQFKPQNRYEVRSILKLPRDKKIILFAAHGGLNNSMKGGGHLINALNILHENYPGCTLLHIGTVDKKILECLKMPNIGLPFIADSAELAKYYTAADVFVSTSLTESFGLTVCEAMACGTPVVAFATGGIAEIVVDKETGLLVKPQNAEQLAEGLKIILNDNGLRDQYGDTARQRVVEKFNVNRMTQAYLECYNSL